MWSLYDFDNVLGSDGVLLVVKGNGPSLSQLNGMLRDVDFFAVLSQHFKGLLLQSNYHTNRLLTAVGEEEVCV